MRTAIQGAAGLTAIGLLAVILGCDDGKPSVDTTREEATVKGTVTLKGKPLGKGEIRFDAANHLRRDVVATNAPLSPEGTYEVKTLVGVNRVTFLSPLLNRDPALQDSTVEFDVQSGSNTLDVSLPLAAPTP